MLITLLTTSSDSFWYIFRHTVPNKMEYCLRWGIQLTIRKQFLRDGGPTIERPQFILDVLDTCDWLWFMGGDTLIMNQTIDVKRFINDKHNLIIGQDVNGINNDVFFLKNSEASKEFLRQVIALKDTHHNDQAAMQEIIDKNLVPELNHCIVPQKFFNAYLYATEPAYFAYPKDYEGNFVIGDFVLHLAAIDNYRREELINEYLPKVIK
jgi:hypothetical protein